MAPGTHRWMAGRALPASFDRNACIELSLRELSRATGETAIFAVREGDARVCVARVLGPHPFRHHVRVGEIRPVERGAPGHVMLAYVGAPGALYEQIRRKGYHAMKGVGNPLVSSVAVPVFGVNSFLIGCVSVAGPTCRFTRTAITKHVKALQVAAAQLTFELGRTAAALAQAQTPSVAEKSQR